MQIAKQVPAFLLGLPFLIFGAAYFLHLMPEPTGMTGDPATYMQVMTNTGYMNVVKVLEVVLGILLLVPKTRALGYVLIAPIVVNILLFEVCISKQPGIGVVLLLVNAAGIYLNKDKYMGILK